MQRTLQALQALHISALVTIGGDDTAFAAAEVANASNGTVRVAHIPKTIDNDLPLPGGVSTFGFETARHVGTQLVRNLMGMRALPTAGISWSSWGERQGIWRSVSGKRPAPH